MRRGEFVRTLAATIGLRGMKAEGRAVLVRVSLARH